jgi:hypothetical protein
MLGKALDIRRFQDRMDCLATIGALGAVDFSGDFLIEIADRKINTPDGEIRPFEKTAECPVRLFAFFRELLNSLNVGFKFHISESLTSLGGQSMVPNTSWVTRVRSMQLGCFFDDSVLCLHRKFDGCKEFGRIEIIFPGLVNDSDLVMTISLFVGYPLV